MEGMRRDSGEEPGQKGLFRVAVTPKCAGDSYEAWDRVLAEVFWKAEGSRGSTTWGPGTTHLRAPHQQVQGPELAMATGPSPGTDRQYFPSILNHGCRHGL